MVAPAPPRILLVDDDSELSALLRRQVERAGYRVVQCLTAAEALSVFQSDPREWAAAVVDLTLPDMTGAELALRLLSRAPDLGLVLTSGSPWDSASLPSRRAAQIRFLQKPFAPSELLDALKAAAAPRHDA